MTRAALRAAAATALTLVLVFVAAACDSDDGLPERPDAAPSSAPSERRAEARVSMGTITGHLPPAARERLATAVGKVVDRWVRAAYFEGPYPRRDFSDSWPGFTRGAKRLAHRDRALMSNEDIGRRIDGVVPNRVVARLDVLSVKQRPVGVTARVQIGFGTTGEVERQVRVQGRLFLTRGPSGWQVFGYDMTKGAV